MKLKKKTSQRHERREMLRQISLNCMTNLEFLLQNLKTEEFFSKILRKIDFLTKV